MKITIEILSKALEKGFKNWGLIDPFYFENPPKEDDGTEYDGLYEALEIVVNALNDSLENREV